MARAHQPTSVWERVVAALGLLLVLGALGFLLYEALWGDQTPPDIIVERGAVRSSGADYLVEFTARNDGGETAASVKIVGTLARNGREIERAETVVDYVPSGIGQHGGLYFEQDPRGAELKLWASGYQEP